MGEFFFPFYNCEKKYIYIFFFFVLQSKKKEFFFADGQPTTPVCVGRAISQNMPCNHELDKYTALTRLIAIFCEEQPCKSPFDSMWNARNRQGETPLMLAVKICAKSPSDCLISNIKFAYEVGTDIFIVDNNGDSPLQFICNEILKDAVPIQKPKCINQH